MLGLSSTDLLSHSCSSSIELFECPAWETDSEVFGICFDARSACKITKLNMSPASTSGALRRAAAPRHVPDHGCFEVALLRVWQESAGTCSRDKGPFFQAREPHPSLRHRGACSTWTHFRKSIIPLETMVETDPLLRHLHEHCFKIATLAHSKLGALAP